MNNDRRHLLRQGAGIVTGIALSGCGALDATRGTAAADPITAPETRSLMVCRMRNSM